MDELEQRIADYNAGYDACMDQAAEAFIEWIAEHQRTERQRWEAYTEQLRRITSAPPRDVLEVQRGNQQRADAIRAFWELTGLRDNASAFVPVAGHLRAQHIARCRDSWGLPSQEVAA